MGERNLKLQGENVHLVMFSITLGSGFITATLFDANWKVRTLQPYERLIIDDLQGICSGIATDPAIIYTLTGNEDLDVPYLIVPFVRDTNVMGTLSVVFAKEGVSLPIGALPMYYQNGGGNSGTQVTGNGRIVEGTTQGPRPNWQPLLTPKGSF